MANVARFAISWRQGTHTGIVTTFFTRRASAFAQYDDAAMNAIAGQVVAWWEDDYEDEPGIRRNFSQAVALTGIEWHRVLPTTSEPDGFVTDVAGTFPLTETVLLGPYLSPGGPHGHFEERHIAGDPLPPQCTVLITLHTDDESRSGRGRMYMPAPPRAIVDDEGRYFGTSEPYPFTLPHTWGRKLYRMIADAERTTPNDRLAVYSRLRNEARTVRSFSCVDRICTQRRRVLHTVEKRTIGVSG